MNDSILPPLDRKSVRAAFARAAARYDAAAVLQREIADRLLARLDYMRIAPQRILDLGCGTGYALNHLRRRYPGARLLGLDLVHAMTKLARAHTTPRLPFGLGRFLKRDCLINADAQALPFADRSFDLVFSNLALQWCNPPGRSTRWHSRNTAGCCCSRPSVRIRSRSCAPPGAPWTTTRMCTRSSICMISAMHWCGRVSPIRSWMSNR